MGHQQRVHPVATLGNPPHGGNVEESETGQYGEGGGQSGTVARIYNEGMGMRRERNGWLSDRFKNNLAGMTRNRRRRGKNKP